MSAAFDEAVALDSDTSASDSDRSPIERSPARAAPSALPPSSPEDAALDASAGPTLVLSDAEEPPATDEKAPSTPITRTFYKCMVPAVVRAEIHMESEKVGELEPGMVVEVPPPPSSLAASNLASARSRWHAHATRGRCIRECPCSSRWWRRCRLATEHACASATAAVPLRLERTTTGVRSLRCATTTVHARIKAGRPLSLLRKADATTRPIPPSPQLLGAPAEHTCTAAARGTLPEPASPNIASRAIVHGVTAWTVAVLNGFASRPAQGGWMSMRSGDGTEILQRVTGIEAGGSERLLHRCARRPPRCRRLKATIRACVIARLVVVECAHPVMLPSIPT